MERWREEVEFDPESMKRIVNVIDRYPMSLHDCADVIEFIAPLCRYFTTNGAINKLTNLIKQYGI